MPINPRPGYEVKPDSAEEYILKNALSNVISLDVAPTTTNAILQEGKIGIHSTNIYITWLGSTYRIAAMTLV